MTEDNNTDWVEQLEEDIEDPYAAAIEGFMEDVKIKPGAKDLMKSIVV